MTTPATGSLVDKPSTKKPPTRATHHRASTAFIARATSTTSLPPPAQPACTAGTEDELAACHPGIGVAAYPSGHPEPNGPHEDIDVLAARQRNGADFAITRRCFDPGAHAHLRHRAEHTAAIFDAGAGGLHSSTVNDRRTILELLETLTRFGIILDSPQPQP